MNEALAARVTGWSLPVVVVVFFALYVMHLVGGVEAEAALIRAGAVGVLLALLARLAVWVLEAAERPAPLAKAVEQMGADQTDAGPNQ